MVELCFNTGLELHAIVLGPSQLLGGDCSSGHDVNYPLLTLSWALFEPKRTSVSTVTVTNGYASLTRQPSMTHIPAVNHNTHTHS